MDLRIQGMPDHRIARTDDRAVRAVSFEEQTLAQAPQSRPLASIAAGPSERVSLSLQAQVLLDAFSQLQDGSQASRRMLEKIIGMGLLDRLLRAMAENKGWHVLIGQPGLFEVDCAEDAIDGKSFGGPASSASAGLRQQDADGRQKAGDLENNTNILNTGTKPPSADRSSLPKILGSIVNALIKGMETGSKGVQDTAARAGQTALESVVGFSDAATGRSSDESTKTMQAAATSKGVAEAVAPGVRHGADGIAFSPVAEPTLDRRPDAQRPQVAGPAGSAECLPGTSTPAVRIFRLTQASGRTFDTLVKTSPALPHGETPTASCAAAAPTIPGTDASPVPPSQAMASPDAATVPSSIGELARTIAEELIALAAFADADGQRVLAGEYLARTRNLVAALLRGAPERPDSVAEGPLNVRQASPDSLPKSLNMLMTRLKAAADIIQRLSSCLAPQADDRIENFNRLLTRILEALSDRVRPAQAPELRIQLAPEGPSVTLRELSARGLSLELSVADAVRAEEVSMRSGETAYDRQSVRIQVVGEQSDRVRITIPGEPEGAGRPVTVDLGRGVQAGHLPPIVESGADVAGLSRETGTESPRASTDFGAFQPVRGDQHDPAEGRREFIDDSDIPRHGSDGRRHHEIARESVCTRQDPIFMQMMAFREVCGKSEAMDYEFAGKSRHESHLLLLDYKPVQILRSQGNRSPEAGQMAPEQAAADQPLDVEPIYS